MKISTYSQDGKKAGEVEVKDAIFKVDIKDAVIHQVMVAMMANQREPWAHTKDRSERRGGGKKPWKQKGTGRARHGSRRSPIWRKGGVTFGPRNEKDYSKKINQKMAQSAMRMVLSGKLADKELKVLEGVKSTEGKTKEMQKMFDDLKVKKSAILVIDKADEKVQRAVGNIEVKEVTTVDVFNMLDALENKDVVLTKAAIEKLQERLSK